MSNERLEWFELRDKECLLVMAHRTANGWVFSERSSWDLRWYDTLASPERLRRAEVLYTKTQSKTPEAIGSAFHNSVDVSSGIPLAATMDRLPFYSCFISHSSKDEAFATRLHADLQSKGVRCWFAPEDLKIGDKLRPTFDEAIEICDKLMVLLSVHSVSSAWVEKEVETAFEKERQQKRTILFPIRLDNAVMETQQAWASDIRRTRHIGDFRNWNDNASYQRALDRLLRDLETERGR